MSGNNKKGAGNRNYGSSAQSARQKAALEFALLSEVPKSAWSDEPRLWTAADRNRFVHALERARFETHNPKVGIELEKWVKSWEACFQEQGAPLPSLWRRLARRLVESSGGKQRTKIYRMPGAGLERFARLVYGQKTFERIFKSELADMQQEYLEALEKGDLLAARIAVVRGWFYFGLAVATHLPLSLVKKIWFALT